MTDVLIDFLIDIAANPAREARFRENPTGELEQLDLTDHERHVLLTMDSSRLRELLAGTKHHANQSLNVKHGGRKKGARITGKRAAGPKRPSRGRSKK